MADTGEDIFKSRCSLCHEGGAGGAPKIGDRGDWEPRAARGRQALYETALNGKPNTAMMAKGGFRDLSNSEVKSGVDYMLERAGFNPGMLPQAAIAKPAELAKEPTSIPLAPTAVVDDKNATAPESPPSAPAESGKEQVAVALAPDIDDQTITRAIAETLLKEVAPPDAKIEIYEGVTTVGGTGIKIQTRMGVVTLSGMVKGAQIIERAEEIAKAAQGVKKVESKLISASIFEWD